MNLKECKRYSNNSIEDDIIDLYKIINERLMIIMVIKEYVNQDIAKSVCQFVINETIISVLKCVYLLQLNLKQINNIMISTSSHIVVK